MRRFNRRRFRAFALPIFPGLCLAAACLLAPVRSQASGGARYVQLRRQYHCDVKLSYGDVQADAAKYAGRVIELRGTVGGMAEGQSSLSVMLNMDGVDAPTLEVPLPEAGVLRDATTPRVRVLARVGEGSSGNVVPLVVLAVANESEVDAQERAGDAQAALQARRAELARQERERWHQQVLRSAPRASAPLPSRSGAARPAPPRQCRPLTMRAD